MPDGEGKLRIFSEKEAYTAHGGDKDGELGKEETKLTTLALTKSPNLKHSPILILSRSVNLISANLITPVKSSLDSGTGLLFDIWIKRVACWGARREIVPVTY